MTHKSHLMPRASKMLRHVWKEQCPTQEHCVILPGLLVCPVAQWGTKYDNYQLLGGHLQHKNKMKMLSEQRYCLISILSILHTVQTWKNVCSQSVFLWEIFSWHLGRNVLVWLQHLFSLTVNNKKQSSSNELEISSCEATKYVNKSQLYFPGGQVARKIVLAWYRNSLAPGKRTGVLCAC